MEMFDAKYDTDVEYVTGRPVSEPANFAIFHNSTKIVNGNELPALMI